MLILAGCGENAPPDQSPLPRVEMTGIATGGPATGANEFVPEVSAKGSAGRPRTALNGNGSRSYAVSLTDLTGPYALTARVQGADGDAREYSVALAQGFANITPLTTLLVAQLYGQDPAAMFQTFGPGGADPARITAANLQQARSKLVMYLHDELAIDVPENLGDFISSPFQAAAGDPMFDTITALSTRLDSLDSSLPELAGQVAQAARLCLVEQVTVTSGSTSSDFCPQSKSATPADEDSTHLDYLFTDRHGNTLAVTVDGDTVTSATYEAAGKSYGCAGSACHAITLDATAADLTRPMHFNNLGLTGTSGVVQINGLLTGAIPGVVLPVLPCDANNYFMVFADRSVVGICANPDIYGLGMTALLGNQQGVAPSRVQYDFDSLDANPNRPRLSVLTDANDALLALQFIDYDEDTYTPRRTFACKLADCNGVTLGPVTVNTDILGSDPPILIRTITLQNTALKGYDQDGNETGETATLTASLNTADFDWVAAFFNPPIEYPPAGSCPSQYQTIVATADSTDVELCLTQGGPALVQTNGDVVLAAGNSETDSLRVVLRAGIVIQAVISIHNQPIGFVCRNDCAGINVSAPDTNGLRTLHFDSALLHEGFLDQLTGIRTLRVNGGTLVFEAQIPQP
ncbi:MAG: hypothetical protein WDO12_01360 [Pseudomonadota bacterium]